MTITTRLEYRAFESFAKLLEARLQLLLFKNTFKKKAITIALKVYIFPFPFKGKYDRFTTFSTAMDKFT